MAIETIHVLTLLLGQAPEGPAMVAGAKLESVWDFVVKGGPTMVVLIGLFCRVIVISIYASPDLCISAPIAADAKRRTCPTLSSISSVPTSSCRMTILLCSLPNVTLRGLFRPAAT